MKFVVGNCVAMGVPSMHEAAQYYENVIGLRRVKQTELWIEMSGGPLRFFIIQDNVREFCLELLAPQGDTDAGAEFLEQHGCLVDAEMSAEAGAPVVRDPYGYLWVVSKG